MSINKYFTVKSGATVPAGSSTKAGGLTLTSGTLKTTPVSADSGSIEYDGTALSVIDSTGARKSLAYTSMIVNSQSAAYILTASDVGKLVSVSSGGVTLNANIFSVGDKFKIHNNSTANQTLTQGTSVTIYADGTTTTGNITIYPNSIITVVCVASNTFIASTNPL